MSEIHLSSSVSFVIIISMERTLIYTTENLITPLPVSYFLKQKGFSSQNLVQLKKDPSAVLANGIPCFMNHVLQPGDTLTLHIREDHSSEKIPPVNLPLNIVYEDADLMVINKPAGMPIHPSMNNYYNSLANALAYYFEQQNCPFVFRCINRLDRDTSGLTIVAKHYVSAGMLSAMIANKATSGITREYLAIAKGSVCPLEGTITAPLGRKEGSIIERTVDFENGESAVTHYRVLDEKNGHSLVSLILETGRTHQIRIHMKYLGYPLIGDYLYNPDMKQIQLPGSACLEAVLLSSHHRGENAVHSTIACGYGSGSRRYPVGNIIRFLRALHSRNRDIHSHYARNFLSAFSRIRHSPCSSKYRSFCSSAAYSPANSIA